MTEGSDSINQLESRLVWSGGSVEEQAISLAGVRDPDHVRLLKAHNGLVAFDGALRVFGVTDQAIPSIATWNQADGWRKDYRELADGLMFFAEDVFGNQFAIADRQIVRFIAELGDQHFVADSFDEWLQRVLDNPDDELDYWLLRSWRTPGNTVKHEEHLCAKIPFVGGGEYAPENLYVSNRIASMTFKGDFAWQIRNVPSGGKVRLRTIR